VRRMDSIDDVMEGLMSVVLGLPSVS